jgi:hypothetical protein
MNETTSSAGSLNDPSSLTLQELAKLFEYARRVIYLHPDDRELPFVIDCQKQGYEIISRETMVKGKAFIQTAAIAGIIDFVAGKAFIGQNNLLDLAAINPRSAHAVSHES